MLALLAYPRERLVGQLHSQLCNQEDSTTQRQFWAALAQGQACAGTYRRMRSDGRGLWLEATYVPVPDADGRVCKVVMLASDVSAERRAGLDQQAQMTALDKSLAVIEFTPDGEIITANSNFLAAVGYSLAQIKGKHHRIFCTDAFYKQNPNFWLELGRGEFKSGQFDRLDSQGRVIWLEATYNPIFDANAVSSFFPTGRSYIGAVPSEAANWAEGWTCNSATVTLGLNNTGSCDTLPQI